ASPAKMLPTNVLLSIPPPHDQCSLRHKLLHLGLEIKTKLKAPLGQFVLVVPHSRRIRNPFWMLSISHKSGFLMTAREPSSNTNSHDECLELAQCQCIKNIARRCRAHDTS